MYNIPKKHPFLTILVILGFFIRMVGTNPGYFAHGDELMYGEAVYMILNGTLGMETQILGFYPPLVAWIMLTFFTLIFIPLTFISLTPELLTNSIDANSFSDFFKNYILGKNWINAMYWGRYTTVIFSTGIIVLTYFLTLRIFKSRLAAVLSALFVTTNYRLVLNSKIGFIDIFGVFFLLASLLAIFQLYEKPKFRNYIFAWGISGLSFLVKYQVYTFAALAFIHLLTSSKISGRNLVKFLKAFLNKGFVIGGVVTILLLAAAHTYHFLAADKVKGAYEYQALKYGLGVNNFNIYPISYIYHVMLGPTLTLLAIGGFAIGISNKNYRIATVTLATAFIPIFFIYFYFSTGGTYTRNLLVILPIALIFSALFLTWIWEKLVKRQKSIILKPLFLLVLFVVTVYSIKGQTKNLGVANQVLSSTSARILIEKYFSENMPKHTTIGVYQGSFLPNENDFLVKTFSGVNEALSLQELVQEGVEYAIVDFHITNSSFVWWMGQPTDIGLKFWNKPNELLSSSFTALAIRELLANYTIQAYLPKWQAPGYSYAVVKLNYKPKAEYRSINKYTFDADTQGWKKIYYFDEIKGLLGYSNESHSLVISKESIPQTKGIRRIYSRPGSLRWESPPIVPRENYTYRVVGTIKNSEVLKKAERNGFLRLDFYREAPDRFNTSPISSFVSDRVYGINDWHEVVVEGQAPEEARFLTVGFQTDQAKNPFYLTQAEVFESKEESPLEKNEGYTITDDDLFNPNDGGFL